MKKKEKQLHSVWSNVLYLLRDIYGKDKLLFVYLATESALGIVLPVFSIYLPKIAVDLVQKNADTAQALKTLGVFALALAVLTALKSMASGGKYSLYNDMRTFYQKRLFDKFITCDYKVIESAKGQNAYNRGKRTLDRGDWSATSVMITSMLAIFTGFMCFILYSSILAYLTPYIVVFLAALTALNYLGMRYVRKFKHTLRDEQTAAERKQNYIEAVAGDIRAGKDIRLYGMAGWLRTLRDRYFRESVALDKKIDKRVFRLDIFGGLILLIRDGAAYAYLIWAVTSGAIALGDFVLYFGAVTGFSSFINRIVDNINKIVGANLGMNDIRDFLENSDEKDVESSGTTATDSVLIEFKDVVFSYDRDKGNVIDGLSMKINPNERVALVGLNGAGKTTLVKLLCKLYRPDSGEIYINGTPLANIPKSEVFSMISAVFQDIVFLPFKVSENVSMKKDEETDKSRVNKCLEEAGLKETIDAYPEGVDSMMVKGVNKNGIELSGGQQQKLLMARALYKDAPILVLDEPTAALDPIAENEVYGNFNTLSKHKTTIFISHRLASTRFCDKIFMIKGGKIAESGTHEELMRAGGEYAGMFEIQSHYYKDGEVCKI